MRGCYSPWPESKFREETFPSLWGGPGEPRAQNFRGCVPGSPQVEFQWGWVQNGQESKRPQVQSAYGPMSPGSNGPAEFLWVLPWDPMSTHLLKFMPLGPHRYKKSIECNCKPFQKQEKPIQTYKNSETTAPRVKPAPPRLVAS